MATKKPKALPEYLTDRPAQALNWGALDDFLNEPAPTPAAEPSGLARRVLGDTGVSLMKGAIAVPEAVVGMADLVTGGHAGKLAEQVGFRPKEAKQILDEYYSPEQQAANRKVQQADGFLETVGTALENPSTIIQGAVESAPSFLPAGAVARTLLKAAPKMSAAVAAGIGEGAVSAGLTGEQVRQESADGLLTGSQSAVVATSGVLIALIGSVANKLANKLGIGDIDQLVAGVKNAGPIAKKGVVRSLMEGFATEGVLQELPQSAQEQVAQNVALGKPWDEGVGNAAAMGALSGGLIGSAAAPFGHDGAASPAPADAVRATKLPETGVLTKGVNAGVEAAAMALENEAQARARAAAAAPAGPSVAAPDWESALGVGAPVPEGSVPFEPQAVISTDGLEIGDAGEIAQRNIDAMTRGRAPMSREDAERISAAAVEQGRDFVVVNHPEGGFWVAPRRMVTKAAITAAMSDDAAAVPTGEGLYLEGQGPAPAAPLAIGYDQTPTGVLVADEGGTVRPETRAEVVNREQDQARRLESGLTPDVERASMRAAMGNQTQPGDILAAGGTPFRSARVAAVAARRAGAGHQVVEISPDNFVVRREAPIDATLISEEGPAADVPSTEQAAQEAAQAPAAPQQAGDEIRAASGNPFKAKLPAQRAAKRHPGYQVVEVEGGWVLRKETSNEGGAGTDAGGADGAGAVVDGGLPGSGELVRGAGTDGDAAGVEGGAATSVDAVHSSGGDDQALKRAKQTPPASIVGEKIDDEWSAFAPESGTLGIPRAEMPQIKAEHRGAMVNFLSARGIEHEQVDIPATDLKPTQAELAPAKVEKAKSFEGGDRSILVSSDGHVLDGHHQWLAKREAGEPVKALRLKAPIKELLAEVKEFPSAEVAEGATQAAEPAAAEAAPEVAPAPKEKGAASAKIDDFGDKLEGARKDYAAVLQDAEALDLRAEPLSKTWPEPDYEKLLASGIAPRLVSFLHAARDEVPTKPQSSWKLKGWVEGLKALRGFAQSIMSGAVTLEMVESKLAELEFRNIRREIGGRAELYQAVGHARSLKGISLIEHHYSLYKGEANVNRWVVEQAARATAFSNWPRELASAESKADAIAQFKARLDGLDLGSKSKGQTQFVVYSKRGVPGTFIGKKIGREHIDLKKMDSLKDAREYLAANKEELERLLAKYKETPLERNEANQPRVGDDHRNGAPVTPEAFADAFGFRGVQFGNYVEQGRRQSDLNQAYDALMDLAAVLGVPTKALSLNGRLGLAFGARGKGGKGAPAAHFEPKNLVINLTKGGGPGSLAHEWWHAADNYFARQGAGGASTGFVTGGAKTDELRAQLRDAFGTITRALASGPLKQRSIELDKRRTKAYWSTPIEMSARAFESYVIAKLQDQGASNDYLANVVSQEAWDATDRMRVLPDSMREAETYPYPNLDEMPAVRAGFDEFFKAVQTKEGEGGRVVMFKRSASGEELAAPHVTVEQDADGRPEFIGNAVRLKFPQPTVRLEVIEPPGQQILNYVIMPAKGFEALGYVELLVQDGKPVSLLDIEVAKAGREVGVGRDVIETLLAADPEASIEISNIVPSARGFWEKMGIPAQNVEGSYDGKLTWQAYAEAADAGRAGRAPRASRAAGQESDAGAEGRGERADGAPQGKSEAVARVEAIVDRLTAKWANAPRVVVIDSMQDQRVPQAVRDEDQYQRSQGADGAPKGFYFKGVAYLHAGKVGDAADVQQVLFHEALGHFGLRGLYGRDLSGILEQIVRARAADVRAKAAEYGLDAADHGDMLAAAEEVLAELAQTRPDIGFVRRAIAAVRSFLRRIGLNLKLSDDEIIRDWILPARAFVERGRAERKAAAPSGAAPAFTRVQEVIRTAIELAGADKRNTDSFDLMPVAAEAVEEAAEHGLDIAGFKHAIDGSAIRHTLKGHGNAEVELQRGQVAVSDADFEAIPELLVSPDQTIYGLKNKIGRDLIGYLKKMPDGSTLYLEEVRSGRKKLTALSLRKYPRTTSAASILKALRPTSETLPGGFSVVEHPAQRNFKTEEGPVAFSRAPAEAVAKLTPQLIKDMLSGREFHQVSAWHRTVGSPYDLAQKNPEFAKVFNGTQAYINDVSFFANDAADLAPRVMPQLNELRDLTKALTLPEADRMAISAPVFEGTLSWARDPDGTLRKFDDLVAEAEMLTTEQKARMLLKAGNVSEAELKRWQASPLDIYEGAVRNRFEEHNLTAGVVFTPEELRSQFKLTDEQIELYQETRAAIDRSLDAALAGDLLRYLGEHAPEGAKALARAGEFDALRREIDAHLLKLPAGALFDEIKAAVPEKIERIDKLKARGYAPLMRFGQYSLRVTGKDGGTEFFSLYESSADAAKAERELAADPEFKGLAITRGLMSQEEFKLLKGLSPETLSLFASITGTAKDEAMQLWLKQATSNRSALRRLIHRKGIEGFSEDVTRVLSSFVTSNARSASQGLHFGEMQKDVAAIRAGDVKDSAERLREYVQNPTEEAAGLRGFLFAHFLGGSLASAAVNMTQPFLMTMPYLARFAGVAQAGKIMSSAMKQLTTGVTGDVKEALAIAEKEGVVSPQELHQLQAMAMGRGNLLGRAARLVGANEDISSKLDAAGKRALFIWGAPFSLAEQFNRRLTFIAAYQLAKDKGMADPFGFAAKAVTDTQGIYNKGNRPEWARGAIGATLFTFKQYTVNYLEFTKRLWTAGEAGSEERAMGRKAALFGLALLFLAAGAQGLPGADDLDDLVDTIGQRMGYDMNSKRWKAKVMPAWLQYGFSAMPGFPLDVAGRLGIGNLIPGTGLLRLDKSDKSGDVLEVAGVAGGLAKSAMTAADAGSIMPMLPTAISNLFKAADMAGTGAYRDTKGRRVIDTTVGEAAIKGIGFQPASVAAASREDGQKISRIALARNTEASIVADWAAARFEGDKAGEDAARKRLADWNADNPETPIAIKMSQIQRRVRDMNTTRAERIKKTAPKELRQG